MRGKALCCRFASCVRERKTENERVFGYVTIGTMAPDVESFKLWDNKFRRKLIQRQVML